MYRGYNLKLSENMLKDPSDYQEGQKIFSGYQQLVQNTLDDFLKPSGAIDALKMQGNWFPQVQADIFISHSHKDEKLAISLAGWLYNEFGLKAFIDSCVWGHSSKLLKIIDKKFCYNDQTSSYIYEKRNLSTSHVHMMLSVALQKMIDSSECVFFLNTPNSITPDDVISGTSGITKSPWIYAEVAMTKLIQKKSKNIHRGISKVALAKSINECMGFEYEIGVEHLVDIGFQDLNKWHESRLNHEYKLDGLYVLK